jgi:hypothetical protein
MARGKHRRIGMLAAGLALRGVERLLRLAALRGLLLLPSGLRIRIGRVTPLRHGLLLGMRRRCCQTVVAVRPRDRMVFP